MKNKIKKNFLCIALILITIFYFEYSVTILWDSAHYMNYVNIFEGSLSWNNWDVVRGPIFPMIIYLGNMIFGKTSQGLLMTTYLFYIVMLIFSYKVLKEFLKYENYNRKINNIIIYIILFLLVICNPIIYGFYHSLLTEFVAITLSVISCYYAYKILNVDFLKQKRVYLLYLLLFAILTVFSWFLKQPYVSCGLFAFVIAMVIAIFEKMKLKNILIRISSIVVCIVFLVFSIVCWNKVLILVGNDPNTSRNPTNSLGVQLINSIDFLEISNSDLIYKRDYIKGSKLSKKEKKDLLASKNKDYVIVNIYDGKKLKEVDYIRTKDKYGNISTVDSMVYIIKIFFDSPIKVLESYLTNYLSIIDIYSTESDDGVFYNSSKNIDLSFSNEITTIAYRPYIYGNSNVFYMTDEMYERVKCYEQTNYVFKGLNFVMRKLGVIFLLIFKIVFLLMPISLITSIIMRLNIKKSNINKNKLNLIIILLGFSFLHILLHTVTGAIIDRYAIPVFITTIFGTLMLLKLVIGYNICFIRKKRNN